MKHLPSIVARAARHPRVSRVVAFLKRQPPINYITAAAVLLLVAYFGYFVFTALSNALLFDGYAADGAFQMLNLLRRVAAGQAVGGDFNTFHGIGVSLLHLPFYYLFGQGLFAAEMSRWLLSPIMFVALTFGFFYTCKRNIRLALIVTAIITVIGVSTMELFVFPYNSMLGVRSALPVLLAIVMLKQDMLKRPLLSIRWLSRLSRYEAIVGALLIACLACGTEFGIAAIIGFFVAHIVYRVEKTSTIKQRLASALRIAAVAMLVLFVSFTIITQGHPLQPLLYALSSVPADQFWYFGVPPNHFLSFDNILHVLFTDASLLLYWLYAIGGIAATIIVHRFRVYRLQTQVFIYALLAGGFAMVSMLGYYHSSEAYALARMSLLIMSVAIFIIWKHLRIRPTFNIGFSLKNKKYQFTEKRAMKLGTFVVTALLVIHTVGLGVYIVRTFDVKKVLIKTKAYVLGKDTSVISAAWNYDDSSLMPVIQADNFVAIADINNETFKHGVSEHGSQVVVDAGGHESFIRFGQIVYFHGAGRQIIGSVQKYADKYLLVSLQNKGLTLTPARDGAPQNLIIAEDFNHNSTKLWSTYSTLFETEMGVFSPNRQHADYIIHALGPDLRQQYVEDFDRTQPQFVMTIRKDYYIYEEWLQNASWDFYSLINANYEAVREGSIHVLWKRKPQPWVNPLASKDQPWQSLSVDAAAGSIAIPDVDWSKVPDVNAYINEQNEKAVAVAQANGDQNAEVKPLLSPADFAKKIGEDALKEHDEKQRLFEGAGTSILYGLKTKRETTGFVDDGRVERPKRAVVLVKLQYQLTNSAAAVPLFGKTARFFVEPHNLFSRTPVSLPPYKSEIVFPVIVSELNEKPSLSLNTYSLLPAKTGITVTSAQWQLLDTSAANLKVLTDWPGPDVHLD